MNLPKTSNFSRGFTLIELMVVMTVIAILATMVLFGLGKAQASARDTSREQIMTSIQVALERYYADNQTYPVTVGHVGWDFGELVTTLQSKGYLASVPVDPNKSCTSGFTYSWAPCAGVSPPQYNYIFPPWVAVAGETGCSGINDHQSYELVLRKESGGDVYFCSPN